VDNAFFVAQSRSKKVLLNLNDIASLNTTN